MLKWEDTVKAKLLEKSLTSFLRESQFKETTPVRKSVIDEQFSLFLFPSGSYKWIYYYYYLLNSFIYFVSQPQISLPPLFWFLPTASPWSLPFHSSYVSLQKGEGLPLLLTKNSISR